MVPYMGTEALQVRLNSEFCNWEVISIIQVSPKCNHEWYSKRKAEGEQTQKRGSQHDHRGRDWSHVATNQGLLMPFGVGDVWEEFSPSGNSIGLFGLHFLFFFFFFSFNAQNRKIPGKA